MGATAFERGRRPHLVRDFFLQIPQERGRVLLRSQVDPRDGHVVPGMLRDIKSTPTEQGGKRVEICVYNAIDGTVMSKRIIEQPPMHDWIPSGLTRPVEVFRQVTLVARVRVARRAATISALFQESTKDGRYLY